MNIHEFQAKQVLAHFGVQVPRGSMTENAEGAKILAEKIFSDGADMVVVKAQIHAGGRGKAGGVKVVKSAEEAEAAAKDILGKTLVTPQTGPDGKLVRKLLVEEGSAIKKELYVSLILDRGASVPAIIASEAGGMEIEEVAKKTPDKIVTVRVDPVLGLRDFQIRELNGALGLKGGLAREGSKLFFNLFQVFMEMDCSQVEINPLVVTEDDRLIALDAKLNFDDTALFRHPARR
jgi:succinyl-CoA synthetase beta subunit